MKGKILLTGGAGYIGAHIVKDLLKEGHEVTVVDNLSSGFIKPIQILQKKYERQSQSNLDFHKGDLRDKDFLRDIFSKNRINAVIHLAAKIDAGESISHPELYNQENYLNSINLVEAMTAKGVNKIIFSSTCAVYGEPKYIPIDEQHPTNPNSPYGETKLDFENYLKKTQNLEYAIFRYFNVGGADPEGLVGRSHLGFNDLLENIMKVALGQKNNLEIYGADYDTEDGTPIRDFIHVEDISAAHIIGLKNLEKIKGAIFNLGSETGFSVKEVVVTAENVLGKTIPIKIAQRKEGDVRSSVASAQKAKSILGWQPQYSDLETIIKTDWNWRKKHIDGY